MDWVYLDNNGQLREAHGKEEQECEGETKKRGDKGESKWGYRTRWEKEVKGELEEKSRKEKNEKSRLLELVGMSTYHP